ncbi:hypothetical protein N1F89_02305 [Aquibium sp. A9E412]|uniref:hypothetical protein n=1 Tax=Aquibium sp. A9E412 TaxID=2976767 RepID=UPI0025AFCD62|nr:hypothetical protein [Aquibium sp. A9E412]MDN2565041.1 hypothetical protein [Aquibium sp. A9E412]
MSALDRLIPKILLALSAFLLIWGILGLFEYLFPALSLGLQNSSFPAGLQFAHFFAIMLTGAFFVFGYIKKWPHTPYVTITMYAVLATLCFVEVIDFGAFGGGTKGVLTMLLEYSVYVGLSIYMFRSPAMRYHFGNASYTSENRPLWTSRMGAKRPGNPVG